MEGKDCDSSLILMNIYLPLDSLKEYKAYEFLQRLLEKAHLHTIRIPRTIYEEVKSNKVFFVANFIHLFWMAD